MPATTSLSDGRGNVWKYAYDANGYITEMTAPDGVVNQYSYDPGTLKLSSMIDGNGNTTPRTTRA